MPLLSITTNQKVVREEAETLLREGASICCDVLNKPADYMQTALTQADHMTMGSRDGFFVFGNIRSIGLPGDSVERISSQLTPLLATGLNVPTENVYLVFEDVPREKWAWNGKTFG